MHEHELKIDEHLVHTLIKEQCLPWAHLPLTSVASSGTDNALFRLGNDYVARLPRVEWKPGSNDKNIDKEYVAAYFNLSQALWLKAYFTKSNSQDYIFYLSKTKEKSNQNEKILADIELFEAIVNITSNDKEISLKGSKLLNDMAEKGNIIAGLNIRKINQIKSKIMPI